MIDTRAEDAERFLVLHADLVDSDVAIAMTAGSRAEDVVALLADQTLGLRALAKPYVKGEDPEVDAAYAAQWTLPPKVLIKSQHEAAEILLPWNPSVAQLVVTAPPSGRFWIVVMAFGMMRVFDRAAPCLRSPTRT